MLFFNVTATTEIYTLSLTRRSSDLARPLVTVMRLLCRVVVVGIIEAGSIRDRKSTRLNSSHITISYAVLCMKKKASGRLDVQPLSVGVVALGSCATRTVVPEPARRI